MASKKNMTDLERNKLVEQMDKDLELFITERVENARREREERAARGEPEPGEDIDTIAERLQNHPAFMTEFDPSKEMSPEMEALQALKYESESPEENATSFKEDGNHNFKLSKYRWAIDNYTAGIKCNAQNKELNAVLYSNRAAANYRIGNFRSAFVDCVFARKFKSDHWKAIFKGIQSCVEMKKYRDAMKWCDEALLLQPSNKEIMTLRTKAATTQKQLERDARKEKTHERRREAEDDKLYKAIMSRGVQLAGGKRHDKESDKRGSLLLSDLESQHPSNAKVHLDENERLIWPVLFLYPEHGQTDFIEAFHEDTDFKSHLDVIFGGEPAPWDASHVYNPQTVEMYFEDKANETLKKIPQSLTLGEILQEKRYIVYGGTPGFIILASGNQFQKHFLSNYSVSDWKS